MVFRFGSRKRKEKQPENEKNEKPKRVGKGKKDNDESNSRPPPVPGSLKSSENRNTAVVNFVGSHKTNTDISTNIQSVPGNRTVLFRDNRFPDGTTMPRIPTTQPHITPPGADRDGQISPTNSIYSTGSLQAAFPSLASYPVSYVPQRRPKAFDSTPRTRGRIHSDGVYRSVYGDPLPKPDYPLSNDGTGNSNRDSGLDTESRSSSGGKPAPTYILESYPQPRVNIMLIFQLSFLIIENKTINRVSIYFRENKNNFFIFKTQQKLIYEIMAKYMKLVIYFILISQIKIRFNINRSKKLNDLFINKLIKIIQFQQFNKSSC